MSMKNGYKSYYKNIAHTINIYELGAPELVTGCLHTF